MSLFVVLLWCAPVAAQTPPAAEPAVDLSAARLRIPAAVWAGGVIADQVTTYRFASGYHDLLHERNVLIRGLDEHPVWLVAAGSAIDASTGWLVYRYLGRRHPRLAAIAFFSAAAYRTYLAAHNLQMMERARQIRATR